MRDDRDRYTYEDAGFNGFFRRTIASDPTDVRLGSLSRRGLTMLNFDNVQTSGSLGDSLTIGNITLDGRNGRIDLSLGELTLTIGDKDGRSGFQVMNGAQVIFYMDGNTWFWNDVNTGNNVMQVGRLPDNTYGWAVAKTGVDVEEIFE